MTKLLHGHFTASIKVKLITSVPILRVGEPREPISVHKALHVGELLLPLNENTRKVVLEVSSTHFNSWVES